MSEQTGAVEVIQTVVLSDGSNYERKNHQPVCQHPLLRVKDLCYAYEDGTPILNRVNFDICDIPNHGQVVSFLGPSGVGKSTLMNIITGTILEGYYGRVEVHDDELNRVVEIHPGLVGKVTQDYWFNPFYTVRKNLETAVEKKKGLTPDERKFRVDEILKRFEMTAYQDKYRGQLSGGQKQRVAIMMQLLCSEHYIVLDEPFTSLDPIMKGDLAKLISEVADMDEHNTMIIVTHDITQALACSDRLLLMGRYLEVDDNGNKILGAHVRKEYNLIDYGIAYQPDVMLTPAYAEVMRDLRTIFPTL